MEKIFYELKPFVCVYLGGISARSAVISDVSIPWAFALASIGLLMLATRAQRRYFKPVLNKYRQIRR